MIRRQARNGIRVAAAAGLFVAVMIGAGPARADQAQDDQYFAALQQIYQGRSLDPAANIGNAHRICSHLANGDSFDKVVNDVRQADDNQESVEQTQREVQLAKSTYCP
ncbi:DUF732 domain-containing protein [Candidatus Mycobacterium wuenschmannii]|uniref:DUF732 domain-containing protein n=1 Tax=Candidatus Mycobacterium wuenschmannii TaxID=3027808 RepID=A0ABY8VSD2_9MYCO|nr:DUF732 domain-containing protein [Candidatus Mycobacterium wuenschmannii]WIM85851.1 DUF732 domain-containing protein [Candidatus Mycobacterium wuenschmannii]